MGMPGQSEYITGLWLDRDENGVRYLLRDEHFLDSILKLRINGKLQRITINKPQKVRSTLKINLVNQVSCNLEGIIGVDGRL